MSAIRRDTTRASLMIVVHGGLNGFNDSRELAEAVGDSIYRDGHYPIFVNWRTDFPDSYAEHLAFTRRGHVTGRWNALLNVPTNLVADVGRGVTRAPLLLPEQARDEFLALVSGDRSGPVNAEYQALRKQFGDTAQIQASLGTHCTSGRNQMGALVRAPLAPLRLLIGVPVAGWVGTAGWDNMVRRSRNVFRRPAESTHRDTAYSDRYRPGQGGASALMDSIARMLREDAAARNLPRPRRVTLVGHSMGAIVLSEMIRLYPTVQFDTIVFMAAAVSSREFHEKVVPYLAAHPTSRFFNLTLHPNMDARERIVVPIAPVGSLLENIDEIYSNPATHVDRTLGKWTNVLETLHLVPDSVRGQISIKGFGYNDPHHPGYGSRRGNPGVHGAFNDPGLGFWRSEFWKPTPPSPRGEQEPRSCPR
jgi:pimeloyl-ACP methyl ester carboxylesterase